MPELLPLPVVEAEFRFLIEREKYQSSRRAYLLTYLLTYLPVKSPGGDELRAAGQRGQRRQPVALSDCSQKSCCFNSFSMPRGEASGFKHLEALLSACILYPRGRHGAEALRTPVCRER